MQDALIAKTEALPEEEEETDFPTMTVNTKPKSNQGSIKALGKHLYPLANNSLKKIPPRPCRHCGCPLHYDFDCKSWIKAERPSCKTVPLTKVNEAYVKSYVAMSNDNEENYETCFVKFLDYLGTSNTIDAHVVEVLIDNCYPIVGNSETPEELKESNVEDSWTMMPINSVELEQGHN
jgi:hypothetical protein